jgi:hypothetical protein
MIVITQLASLYDFSPAIHTGGKTQKYLFSTTKIFVK